MAELRTLARPYARAAFEYADAAGELDAWLTELSLIAAVVSDERVENMLSDPALTTKEQADRFIEVCGDDLGDSRQRYVKVLAENRRLALAPEIVQLFAQLKAQREQTVEVEVISAFELPESVRDRIAAALGNRLQRKVVVSSETDSSLIGGVLIRAGDLVIDGSVRGRLNKLSEALTH
jgi:F-type H+-transporting ATPase subunit delta